MPDEQSVPATPQFCQCEMPFFSDDDETCEFCGLIVFEPEEDAPPEKLAANIAFGSLVAPRQCFVCGCIDDDCSRCIERTGYACHWVSKAHHAFQLCSACVDRAAEIAGRLERMSAMCLQQGISFEIRYRPRDSLAFHGQMRDAWFDDRTIEGLLEKMLAQPEGEQ